MMRPPGVPLVHIPAPDAPVISRNGTVLPPYNTLYEFDQLIDHKNPSLGTFKQRFWHTYEFYEPGGPIILSTPGETNAGGYTGYLTNRTINGLIAQQENGSTIVLEHRFYGFSNPYPDLSVASLKYHTIQQAIDDLEYFAKNVHLPMPGGDQLTPDKAPWILIGGSYSGALTSWTMVNKPGLFFAGYSSSGVVQAILDFWQYFEPIRQNMPQNCSTDVQAVMTHIDRVFLSGNKTAIQAIKESFGMESVKYLDDVAGALRNNLWDWQSLQVTSGPGAQFYQFCDALEVKDGQSAPASGWGLDHALSAWSNYWKTTYYATICGEHDAETCLGTYDTTQTSWHDTSIDNAGRSWTWIVCNEVGYFQEGAPLGQKSIVTRLVQPPYEFRQCQQMFTGAFPYSIAIPNTLHTNLLYRGWNVKVDRLFFANGIRDPWREATMSAQGLNAKSTLSQPIALSDGFHCSDLGASAAQVDPTIATVHKQALESFRTWLSTWKPRGQGRPVTSPRSLPQPARKVSQPVISKPLSAWLKGAGVL